MPPSLTATVLAAIAVPVGYLLARKFREGTDSRPPGPRRWPLIGSVLEMPRSYQWLKFAEWAKTYGSIVYLEAVGQPIVVLNSAKVAKDLLDQRSSLYSDRPNFTMANLVTHSSGYGEAFAILPYGDKWRQQRKIVAQEFGPGAVHRYHPLQEEESRKLIHGIVDDPNSFARQIQLRVGAIIVRATYGHYLTSEQDVFLTSPLTSMENFSKAGAPGAWLRSIQKLPEWTPWSSFLRTAKEWRALELNNAWDPYLWSKKNWESNTVLRPNLCATTLEALEGTPSKEQEERLVWAASTVMGGGLDPNVSSIMTFFLAMMLNPSVQTKARQEIDTVIGSDRLPTIQDRESLPYIRSIMTEVFRWKPAVPLGIPHALIQDDVYDGMYLPKGSLVIPNVWYMLRDPQIYHDPLEFDPDRYQNLDSEMDKVTDLLFGFGRRSCPGQDFAEGTFFAIVSTILATCEISPTVDAQGVPVIPDVTYTSGVNVFPSPFNCNVKCRSERALERLSGNDDVHM
ncbi:putative monooxygenase [Mycena rosella]|uniref:Monooxygenase n=1 Tax=Mycena rosella TaxID=1033263 RepID=A0AAD7CR30_MYCRO|nr:putative monooxygenase [Mycena rosella]